MPRPVKCISVDKARELQKEWKSTRGKEIERGQGYIDTREFWYSVDELLEYLDYVKEMSAAQGISKPGIRIYLGAYPQKGPERSYSTVFLSPTMESLEKTENGEEEYPNNYDIDPLNESQQGWPPTEY